MVSSPVVRPLVVVLLTALFFPCATASAQTSTLPTSMDFGACAIGTTATLMATTSGQANVLLYGTSASDFLVRTTSNPDGSNALLVSFAPTASGLRTASVYISDNAGTHVVALTGTGGTTGGTSLTPASVSITPTSAALNPGGTTTFTASVSNSTNNGVFWAATGGSIFGAGNAITYTAPTAVGSYSVIATSMADPKASALAVVTVSAPSTMLLSASPSAISFGSVLVGGSATRSVSLTNTGSSAVTITSATTTGTGFTLAGVSFPFTLVAGASTATSIGFAPLSSGAANGSVSFVSNATNSPATVALSGSGTAQQPHTVTLSWQPGSSTDAGYNVYRAASSGGPYARVNTTSNAGTNFVDSSVASGHAYYYVVTALNSSGRESGYSNQVAAVVPSP